MVLRGRGRSVVGPDQSPGSPPQVSAAAVVPICVRVATAMALLGIGKTKLYELLASGQLEAIRVGRRTLVLQESIDGFVERLRGRKQSGAAD